MHLTVYDRANYQFGTEPEDSEEIKVFRNEVRSLKHVLKLTYVDGEVPENATTGIISLLIKDMLVFIRET